MAIGNVTISGMASGLPPDIVDQLMTAQQTRLKAFKTDKEYFSSQRTAIGELETKMLALGTKAKELQETLAWSPHTVASSDTDRITATADSTAQSANHTVYVGQLATYDSWSMKDTFGIAKDYRSTATLQGASGFTFTYNGTTYGTGAATPTTGFTNAELQGKTIDDLATAINGINYGSEDGVGASVLFDGQNYRLILTAKDSGTYSVAAPDRITVDASSSLDFITPDLTTFLIAGGDFHQANGSPKDAKLLIDEIQVSSSSNQVSDALTGVTLNLKSVTAGTTYDGAAVVRDATAAPVNVVIENDKTALKKTLQDFLDAFNGVIDYVNTKKDKELSGESLTRSVISQIRGVLNTATADSATGNELTPFSTLASMGLRTDQKTGKISFDSSSLDTALTTNFNSVTKIFTSEHASASDTFTEGIAHRMKDLIDSLTNSTGGAVTGKKEGLKARIDRLDQSITRENDRLQKVRESLTLKFSHLEQMITKMNGASGSLTSTLSKLNK